jgi:hypothetical protein
VDSVFNLAFERGDDPDRLIKEQMDRAIARGAAREYELKMQRTFADCPGFIGGDLPESENAVGKVVIEPARVTEAVVWLKRRFHVNETMGLPDACGLTIEVKPRRKAVRGQPRARVTFEKPKQYEFELNNNQ